MSVVRLGSAALVLCTASAGAESLPILVDGDVLEWTPTSLVITDPVGDDGSSGVDFTELYVANDETRLYLRFDTTIEVQGDEGQDLVFALDTDRNPSTGEAIGGIGAELEWRLGERAGFEHFGSSGSITHPEIGLLLAPTVSATEFELAIRRDAVIGGQALFGGDDFDIVVLDDGGDQIGAASYTFAPDPQPVPSLSLSRDDTDHIRIAAFNVLNDGLFDAGAREDAFVRLLGGIDADVWLFSELWNFDAGEIEARVEELVPSGAWNAVKLDSGNAIVSQFPILDTWEVSPGDRITAALLDVRPRYDSDVLVIVNHWSCCSSDGSRQRQADALVAFMRDARTPGGAIDLVEDTPIVAGGDFNLVGLRQQLETTRFGDIVDNGTYGPDSPPDWDGSPLEYTNARHPDARTVHTWRNDFSSFYPGKLDYVFYTGSVVGLHNHVVVDTRGMSAASLSAAGLEFDDSEVASDHVPIVADFSVGAVIGVATTPAPVRVFSPYPNPTHTTSTVSFVLADAQAVTIDVFDVGGRRVRRLGKRWLDAGSHDATWDGLNEAGHAVAPGVYEVVVNGSNGRRAAQIVRTR